MLAALVSGSLFQDALAVDRSPKLLLNAQRLRRLKRDRERQTQRWLNFEQRVRSVADSPERGFELALYFAVTGDPDRGKEAIAWARSHPCEIRQAAIVADWVGSPLPDGTRNCPRAGSDELVRLRNAAFFAIASGNPPQPSRDFLPTVTRIRFEDSDSLYAAVEYLDVMRSVTRHDLREGARRFFIDLPYRFLLSLSPQQLARPPWRTHAAALALVSLDPNLEGSQFLQAWAMEAPQTIQDGPGLAYELLWANPYLPGVSYRNMEPALYDEEESRLIARTSWDDDACRIEIAPGTVMNHNCPAGWQTKPISFGNLNLVPLEERCTDVAPRPNNGTMILWNLKPGARVTYAEDGKQQTRNADAAGMLRISAEFRGKVCTPK